MYGAIIGDLAGSIYEYAQIKKVKSIKMNNVIEVNSFYSDDTILTMAVLDAILSNGNYEEKIREYITNYLNYKPNVTPYFDHPFSPSIIKWSKENIIGISSGNGAMMRISPIGYMFNSEIDIINNAKLATMPTHNSLSAIKSATLIALIIFYARYGLSKKDIINKLNIKLINKRINKFNYTCDDTIDICLYAFFNSNSFKECIENTLLYGGDTDTNCAIVGSMAEAMYGINSELIKTVNKYIPESFQKKLVLGYKKINTNENGIH